MPEPRVEPRMTPQRRAVLDVLAAAHDHPTAAEICDRVRARTPGVGAATVYRALGLLVQTGQAIELSLGEAGTAGPAGRGSDRYDARVDAHDHVVCTRCGSAADVDAAHPAFDRVARDTGFHITGYDLQFHGVCPSCRAATGTSPA